MSTTPYLDATGYKALALMPAATIDDVEALSPGWLAATLAERSRYIDSLLGKRYATPFSSPYPEVVCGWLARLMDRRVLRKRGYVPADVSATEIIDDEKEALAQIKEAADSEKGMYELPLRADTTGSGISKPQPLGYSEASPYVAFDIQAENARNEDANGFGTGDDGS